MDNELFQPYERLVEIRIQGRRYQVPSNNLLLRCFQYMCMEDVSCGRFCWNQECKTCAIAYELESGEPKTGLSCQTMVVEGMEIIKITKELEWALRSILGGLASESSSPVSVQSDAGSLE
jgi:predicted molibdopterin-dependent oxidoreductase YjgC